MLFAGGAVLIVACALHIAWVGRLARDRGRSVIPWLLAAIMAGGVGLAIGIQVMERAADAEGTFVGLLGALAPFPFTLAGMLIVAAVVHRLPAHVEARREWKVSAPKTGEGTLVLEPEAIELRWEAHTDRIARSELRSAAADGECVRLIWASGEALLMPMMSPQTRDGRIRQSALLARLLSAPGEARAPSE